MDLRINKLRLFHKDISNFNPVSVAEAMAERSIAKIRPALMWIYELRRRLATVAVGVLTFWMFVHVMFGANGMMVYRVKRAEVRSLQKEIDALQTENNSYSKEIDNLKSDPKTIEKEARERLHYARPGEVVYISPAPATQELPQTDTAQK